MWHINTVGKEVCSEMGWSSCSCLLLCTVSAVLKLNENTSLVFSSSCPALDCILRNAYIFYYTLVLTLCSNQATLSVFITESWCMRLNSSWHLRISTRSYIASNCPVSRQCRGAFGMHENREELPGPSVCVCVHRSFVPHGFLWVCFCSLSLDKWGVMKRQLPRREGDQHGLCPPELW